MDEVESNSERLGGYDENGQPKIVEIDESLFFKSKYNRGRQTAGQWYVGGVERGSKRVFLIPVSNRNAETMTRIIVDNVLPGTIVITDQWRAYASALNNMPEYNHLFINHSLNFVCPTDPNIHTQSIEGFWSQAKRFLRERHGIKQTLHVKYLLQFIWEYNCRRCFLNTISPVTSHLRLTFVIYVL
jgi:transposase